MSFDLIVVGAGPAGAATACLAARSGMRVALVERKRFPREKVCGEFVSAEGVAVLERLGIALEDAPSIANVRITDPAGRPVASALPHRGRGLTRSAMDARLVDRAERDGVTLFQPRRVVEPIVEAGRVVGVDDDLRAPIVVAADGRRSTIARKLGVPGGDPRRTGSGSWFGLKCHLRDVPGALDDNVELHLFRAGYVGLAQVEAGRSNLCLMTRAAALRREDKCPEQLLRAARSENPALDAALGDAAIVAGWQAIGPLRFGVREPASHGVLFVGDAAGTIDPFSGEGISNALVAAELVQPFLRAGAVSAERERDYREIWMERFASVTRRNRRLGRLFGAPRLSSLALGLLRGAGRAALPRLVAATRTGAP